MSNRNQPLQIVPAGEKLPPAKHANPGETAAASLAEYSDRFAALQVQVRTILASDPSVPLNQELARTCRLSLRDVRTELEHKRVELGDEHLRAKQKIDGAAKQIKETILPIEKQLQDIEDYEKIQLAKRIQDLAAERYGKAVAAGMPLTLLAGKDLGRMSEADYQAMMAEEAERQRKERETAAQLEAGRKAQAELAEARKKENERMAAQLERERKEHEAKFRAEAEEKAKIAAQAAAEKARREAAEAELLRKHREEEAKAAAADLAKRRAAALPDKEKLLEFADVVLDLGEQMPAMVTADGAVAAADIHAKILAFSKWIAEKAGKL